MCIYVYLWQHSWDVGQVDLAFGVDGLWAVRLGAEPPLADWLVSMVADNLVIMQSFRPCLIRPKPHLDFKIRILKPWGCKQTECWIRIRFELSRKQMQNLDLVFIQMSLFINFIRTNFIKMSLCCLSYFLFWNCGLRIAKTNCPKFPLRLARRRPPYWIQWIRLLGWFHGFTNPDSVSENLA